MQLISTLALAASASALVAPAAPKASPALKGATLDAQLKKIPGVSPLKNAPADYGFDPLGFAKVSYPRFGLPEDDLLRTTALRDAELRHGRLALLAVQVFLSPSSAPSPCSRRRARSSPAPARTKWASKLYRETAGARTSAARHAM